MEEAYNPNNRPHLPDRLPPEVAASAAREAALGLDEEWRDFNEQRVQTTHGEDEISPQTITELTQEAKTAAPSATEITLPDLSPYDQSAIPPSEFGGVSVTLRELPQPKKRSWRQKLSRILPINTGRHTRSHTERTRRLLKRSLRRASNVFKARD